MTSSEFFFGRNDRYADLAADGHCYTKRHDSASDRDDHVKGDRVQDRFHNLGREERRLHYLGFTNPDTDPDTDTDRDAAPPPGEALLRCATSPGATAISRNESVSPFLPFHTLAL